MTVRQAVRAVLVDPDGAVFLMRVVEPVTRSRWWVAPGGGIDGDEDHLTALCREVSEELGHELAPEAVGPAVWERHVVLTWNGRQIPQFETYYLVRCDRFDPPLCRDGDGQDDDGYVAAVPKWWTSAELRDPPPGDNIVPVDLADLLDRLVADGPPPSPITVT
ncbi:MAG TPA: NUDIX domain-containing protein [Acidimicrobiales bacterium]